MSIEKTLFAAADKMRGSMDAGEYKHIALGLLFLRYVSVSFQRLHDRLSTEDYSDPEDRDDYLAENVFWVPEKARWSFIAKNARDPGIGVMIDDAMREIEAENPSLRGALPKVFGKESLDKTMLTGLIGLFTNDIRLDGTPADFDLIIHGTTLATNALIQRRGAKVAFLTTAGHKDTLAIAREERFEQYDINIDRAKPLVPRHLRIPITERLTRDGEVFLGLNKSSILKALKTIEN